MHARTRHSIIAATLALTAACVPPAGAPATDAAAVRLQDTAWTLVELGGAPVTPDADGRRPSLRLDGATARFTGFGGCNRLSGAYELDGGTLRFPTIGATRMYCAPTMQLEQAFVVTLEATHAYRISDTTLGPTLELIAGDRPRARLRPGAPDRD
jgi:putative lipoprotein